MKNNNWIWIILIIIGAYFLISNIDKKTSEPINIREVIGIIFDDTYGNRYDYGSNFGIIGEVSVDINKCIIQFPNQFCYNDYVITVKNTQKFNELKNRLGV